MLGRRGGRDESLSGDSRSQVVLLDKNLEHLEFAREIVIGRLGVDVDVAFLQISPAGGFDPLNIVGMGLGQFGDLGIATGHLAQAFAPVQLVEATLQICGFVGAMLAPPTFGDGTTDEDTRTHQAQPQAHQSQRQAHPRGHPGNSKNTHDEAGIAREGRKRLAHQIPPLVGFRLLEFVNRGLQQRLETGRIHVVGHHLEHLGFRRLLARLALQLFASFGLEFFQGLLVLLDLAAQPVDGDPAANDPAGGGNGRD